MNAFLRGFASIAEGLADILSFGEMSNRRLQRHRAHLSMMESLRRSRLRMQADLEQVRSRQRWLIPVIDGKTECWCCGDGVSIHASAKAGQSVTCPHCGAVVWLWPS